MTSKISLVTGAARGIGLATTKLFLAEGHKVVMVDRDREELDKAAATFVARRMDTSIKKALAGHRLEEFADEDN